MGSGSDREREMQNFIYDVGEIAGKPYVAIRFPGSGSNPRHEMPDLLVKIEGKCYVFEVKYTSGAYASFPKRQLEGLIDFADGWDAEPRVAARFSQYYRQFYLDDAREHLDKMVEKDVDSLSMKRSDMDEFDRLEDLFDVDFDPEEAREKAR